MTKIRFLDNLTIQKIAAGEVIERPASIVKELVENSLDANAKSIVVEIVDGGKSLIRITDDGDGMEEEDLAVAFERHSTSKLSAIEDLYSIMTLGFRGEALSSVSSVAKVEVLTKTNSSHAGNHARIEEGKIISIEKIGSPKGTTMIVRDLFYNLPVRKKFLRSDATESNVISDIVTKLALGNFNTSFKFIKDNKVILQTNSNGDMEQNIYTILGRDITKGLIPIEYNNYGIKVKGFISDNHLYRSNRNHQYIYINGRYIVNYSISNAIENHYKSLIPLNRYPVFVLYIDMDPGDMDVNIHPTKQEVKFLNHNDIHGIIGSIIKDHLFPSLSIPSLKVEEKKVKVEEQLPELFYFQPSITDGIVVKDYTSEDLDIREDIESEKDNYNFEFDFGNMVIEKTEELQEDFLKDTLVSSETTNSFENDLGDFNPIGVVFGTYIFGENRNKDKMFFIDQHAAHERVMYERFKNEFHQEKIHIQQLLMPEIIDLTNSEMNNFQNNILLFEKLGFEIEEFGGSSISIRGVPFIFGEPNIRLLFLDILDNLDKDVKSAYDTRIDKIMKLACTSAIKSGDRISNIEIKSLIRDLILCDNPYSCPHGRPTVIEMTKRYIEKQFLRII